MKHTIYSLVVCAYFVCLMGYNASFAQEIATLPKDTTAKAKKTKHRFLSVGLCSMAYRGDLSDRYRRYMPGLQIGLQFENKKRLNGMVSMLFGSVTGDNPLFAVQDMPNSRPNLSFRTRLVGFQYELQLNLVNTKWLRIFVSQGLGILNYVPQDTNKKNLFEQTQTRAPGETYGAIAFSLPIGLGFRLNLPNKIKCMLSTHWQNPQTDYLDNIAQWGNKKGNDNIFMSRLLFQIPL